MSSKCDVCFTSVIGLSNVIFLFVNLSYQIALFSNSLHSHSIPGSPVSWLITSQGHCNPHSCGLDFLGQFGLHKLANKRDRSFPYNIQRCTSLFWFLYLIFLFISYSVILIFLLLNIISIDSNPSWDDVQYIRRIMYSMPRCFVVISYQPSVPTAFSITSHALGQSYKCPSASKANLREECHPFWCPKQLSVSCNSPQLLSILSAFKWFIGMNISQFDSWIQFLIIPPEQRSCWGYIGFSPSVRPSVRLSRLPCPLCNICSSGWILSILATNDHYYERVCRTQWPLTLTYIFKVIWPWLRKSCPLCSVYSSR